MPARELSLQTEVDRLALPLNTSRLDDFTEAVQRDGFDSFP